MTEGTRMATATPPIPGADLSTWRCVACDGRLAPAAGGLACEGCGRDYPVRDGVAVVKEHVDANNKVAQDFYDSPLWPKFRFWEWYTFVLNGGERRSRDKILRHLPTAPDLKLLDVAVGDGVYLDWLPKTWDVTGVDISTSQLAACRRRLGDRPVPLIQAEAEDLPFRDGVFDAALSIGGFNYFNDPEKSLREMVRVTRPGGTIVVADEVPDLTDKVVFGKVGLPGIDRWFARLVLKNLGPDFIAVVERLKHLDVAAIGKRVLPESRYELVWHEVGYVLVGEVPG